MGDFLYTLLLLAVFVFSIYNKAKKLNKKNAVETLQRSPEIEEPAWENETEVSEYTRSVTSNMSSTTPVTPKTDASKRENLTSKKNTFQHIENESNNELELKLDSLDEAKKAFIYSEIFQRKY